MSSETAAETEYCDSSWQIRTTKKELLEFTEKQIILSLERNRKSKSIYLSWISIDKMCHDDNPIKRIGEIHSLSKDMNYLQ